MKILFRTQSDNPEYNADCDCAVVDMTPALWEEVRRRVEIARQALQADGDVYTLYFWGGTADFYPYRLVVACEEAVAAATEGPEQEKSATASSWSAQVDDPGYAPLAKRRGPRCASSGANRVRPDDCPLRAVPRATRIRDCLDGHSQAHRFRRHNARATASSA